MGLLDTIMSELPREHTSGEGSGITTVLAGLLQSGQGAGLSGLAQKFNAAGLGQAFGSWVGNGPNQPVGPDEVHRALGPDQVQGIAQQSGISKDELLPLLAQYLPKIVSQLTPQGRLPDQQPEP